jgi:hypothetical protein
MLTLIVCLFWDFIYLQYKKEKKILLIKQKKKKSLSKLNHNTYLLNFEDEDRTTNRD